MTIDNQKLFYSITSNSTQNDKNDKNNADEFSKILAQENKKQESINANPGYWLWKDSNNNLLSLEEHANMTVLFLGAEHINSYRMEKAKMGVMPGVDFNDDENRAKQVDIFENGTNEEKKALLQTYQQIINEKSALPSATQSERNRATAYLQNIINKL